MCHLPLLPSSSEDDADEDYGTDLSNGVRLLNDEGVPRQSEDTAGWQNHS